MRSISFTHDNPNFVEWCFLVVCQVEFNQRRKNKEIYSIQGSICVCVYHLGIEQRISEFLNKYFIRLLFYLCVCVCFHASSGRSTTGGGARTGEHCAWVSSPVTSSRPSRACPPTTSAGRSNTPSSTRDTETRTLTGAGDTQTASTGSHTHFQSLNLNLPKMLELKHLVP